MASRTLTQRAANSSLQAGVQTIGELRLAATSSIDDKQGVYVEDENSLYFYDYDSSAPESLPDIVHPTAGIGRWVRHGHLAGGGNDDLYRRKWWQQEEVIEGGDTVTLPEDTELIIQTLVVDGDIDVQGDLIAYDDDAAKKYRPMWAQPTTVAETVDDVLPAGSQLVIAGQFTVDGDLDVQGDLVLLDDDAEVASVGTAEDDYTTRTVIATDSLQPTDRVIFLDASGGPFTFTMSSASDRAGRPVLFKRINAGPNVPVVQALGGEYVEFVGTWEPLVRGEAVEFVADGTINWFAI